MSNPLYFYKLKLEYKGTRYLGWQIQKDFEPTVQGELNKACKQIFQIEEIHTVGSGRTDTGVHSLGHIVKLKAPFKMETFALIRGLNSLLPEDIRVLEIEDCEEDFLPTNHAIKKEYKYLFSANPNSNAFQNDFIVNCRFDLDIKLMQEACRLFIGSHDFSDFQCVGSVTNSNIREILECELIFHKMDFHGILPDHYVFRVVGNGFLKQMIRLMMGTLWEIGRGKTTIEELKESLSSPLGKRLGPVAKPQGLFKVKVDY